MIHLKDRNIFIMSIRELRRTLTSFHIIIQKYISSETSASLRISEDTLQLVQERQTHGFTILVYRPHQESHFLQLLELDQLLSFRTSPSELPIGIAWIHRGTRISKIQRSTRILKISDAASSLYQRRLIFTDPSSYIWSSQKIVRLRTPGLEAKPDTGDAALYRQLFTYQLQKNKMILIQEMLLFTDNSPHICCRITEITLGQETLIFLDSPSYIWNS